MLDGLKGYVALVSGLTEATAAKAREVATALLAQGGVQGVPSGASAMATQIAGLAEDLLVTARDNRGVLMEVVRAEAERAVASLGVITAAEADALRTRISDLEAELASERARAAATRPAPRRATAPRTAKKTPTTLRATKTSGTRTPATKTSATKTPATKTSATKKTTPAATKKTATKKSAAATRSVAAKKPAAAKKSAVPPTTPGDRAGE